MRADSYFPYYRRLIVVSVAGLAWLVSIGLLWAYPRDGFRRGWTYESFGVFESFVVITPYRTGGSPALQAGEGLGLTIILTLIVTAVLLGGYYGISRNWRVYGQCKHCGYELYRGLYQTGPETCPECGVSLKS